jgi:O-glycosyl hydrolase
MHTDSMHTDSMHTGGHLNRRLPHSLIAAAAAIVGGTLAVVPVVSAAAAPASAGSSAASSSATINGAVRYQRIAGFGASEAFGQAATIMSAPAATQQQALNLLFSPVSGAGLTILRNEVGADPGNTIEPDAPSSPSAPPSYVTLQSIDSDSGQLWLAQTIKKDYGVRDVFADAWSAPAYMKTNDSTANGGTLCGVPDATCATGDWRQAYARYLVQYAEDYARAGVPLSYIGFENEANLAPDYDGMVMTPAQTANFAPVIGSALARSGLPTKLECCATEGWDYAAQYASAIEADPAALRYVSLFTSHGYTAWPVSPLPGWSKPVWETEWSTFESWDPAWDDGTDASGLAWAEHIYSGLTSANLSAFLYWWGSSEPTFNGDNESLIQINGSTVSASGRLWAFANYSRFVRPGAVRIGAATSDSGLELTAFRNLNGSTAIVVLNTATSADSVSFALQHLGLSDLAAVTPYLTNSTSDAAAQAPLHARNGQFTATLPARSLVTFVISR